MEYWSALAVVKQIAGELGLPVAQTIAGAVSPQINQLVALTNSSGNELFEFYPWQQFLKKWEFDTVDGQESYTIPDDWAYFLDQTQWDNTNRWPLLGPRSPQEWAWIKAGNVSSAPRSRYRVYQDKFYVHPVPGATSIHLSMEYVNKLWIKKDDDSLSSMMLADTDTVLYNPWLIIKFVKLKFYELKAFDTSAVRSDFMRIYLSLVGKDKGAPVLSLVSTPQPYFIGPWSVPDGSWDVGR